MRRYLVPLALVATLASPAYAQVSRPNPSSTPRGDQVNLGVPVRGTPVPECTGKAMNSFFADSAGCIYACAGQARRVVASAPTACALPTGVPTATPTATATPTPTLTATATPTPTATSTP